MSLGKYIAMASNETSESTDVTSEITEEATTETGATGGLLGDLSTNFRILIMVAGVVILFFIMRELYIVLINREWHPANAKLLTSAIFFTLVCAIFTVLFLGQVLSVVIIIFWIVLGIFILFAFLKRHR